MKLAISTDNNQVSGHFGRCQLYTIVEIEDNRVIRKFTIDTPPHQPGFLPKFLHEKGIHCVITGGMGPRAQTLFQQLGIEPVIGVQGEIDDVIRRYLDGKLERGASQCSHGDSNTHHSCGEHSE